MTANADYEAARRFVLLCDEAGIKRPTRNYLWQGFREEGLSLAVSPNDGPLP